jgi:hypothetical protein
MKRLTASLALVFLCLLSGCSAIEWANNNPATADFVIKVATTQYIDSESDPAKRIERAQAVNEKVSEFKSFVGGNPSLSLDDLEQQFRDSIDWVSLDIGDKILADALIQNVRLQLESKVSVGEISEDYTVPVKTLLNLVISATRLYGVP